MRAHGVLLCFGSVSASMAVLDHLTQGRRSPSPWAVRPVLRRARPRLTLLHLAITQTGALHQGP
jgi:hypothetical protein